MGLGDCWIWKPDSILLTDGFAVVRKACCNQEASSGEAPSATSLRKRDPRSDQDSRLPTRFFPWKEHSAGHSSHTCERVGLTQNGILRPGRGFEALLLPGLEENRRTPLPWRLARARPMASRRDFLRKPGWKAVRRSQRATLIPDFGG